MDIKDILQHTPTAAQLANYEELLWINPDSGKPCELPFSMSDIDEAEARLQRFAPYLAKAFPETAKASGIIESDLAEIARTKPALEHMSGRFQGRLLLKCDSHLPVSGSIKARGGIYEVLKLAERLALEAGMLRLSDDYSILCEDRFRELFSEYSVAVGSTGNLGLSIGIISARLGFRVTVHMSADARRWKKELLRSKGVNVIEYPDDYQVAVAEGRRNAANDPKCHFVDDEGSADLFLGYAVAAKRLVPQLREANVKVDDAHPLFVYIPCGVGGAPGGVAFGLKQIFGSAVHIFFAEPTHAPCMTLALSSGLDNKICCADIGIDGITDADGLAVGRASGLVAPIMHSLLDGCFTVSDEKLYAFLTLLADREKIYIEPSSCASFTGPALVSAAADYLTAKGLCDKLQDSTHILWATGGSMVPDGEMKSYYERGKV